MITPKPGDIVTPPSGDQYGFDVTQHDWFEWFGSDEYTTQYPVNYAQGHGYQIVAKKTVPVGVHVRSGDRIVWSPGFDLAYNLSQSRWFLGKYVQAIYHVGDTDPWTQA